MHQGEVLDSVELNSGGCHCSWVDQEQDNVQIGTNQKLESSI